MHAQPHAIKRFQLPGFAWVLLAVVTMFVFSQLGFWIFWADAIHFFSPVLVVLNIFHLSLALMVWACVSWLHPWLTRRYPYRLAPRMTVGLLVALAGVVVVTMTVYGPVFEAVMGRPVRPGGLMHVGYRAMMITLFVTGWLLMRGYAGGQAAEALRVQLETEALATDVDRSELAMLEAQIEPHFLFNTLAHIKRMYRVEEVEADRVLGTLIDYLERALPALRRADWTVGDELELVRLYLELIEQRFAGRLRFAIAAAPAAAALQLPALTVATLVENAVRHGLAPKTGDGQVCVEVTLDAGVLRIDVADDGVGLRQSSGSGLGLATVRARLRGKFGTRADVIVQPGSDGGVLASIVIRGAHD